MQRLKDKVALVTGAALGIGAAIARRMAEEGATVMLTDTLVDEGHAMVKALKRRHLAAAFHTCDVSEEIQVKDAVTATVAVFGKIDILVNNAGISGVNKPTHEISVEEWERVQAVNVRGVFLCTKYAIPHMKRDGGGSIINLSSIYGLVGAPDVPPYHASKGAVRMMTKTDALTYAADKIRVNSIHPGFIWTPMVENHLAGMPDPAAARRATAQLHPLGHMGEPDDIAWGALYLASDEAKFVTGSELVIDGGYTAH